MPKIRLPVHRDEISDRARRTGRFLRSNMGVEPTWVLLAKSLSAGMASRALITRKWIFDSCSNRMDRAVVHGSTFDKNDLAMAAGIAPSMCSSRKLDENAERTASGW